ncbi:MAG: DUF72 domain-containing protein [Elusimicrobia bacterium]|nr:DUF72 domain-containing protein [Elusimicrobiota bacterium]
MKFFVGTSGWNYDDFENILYKGSKKNRLKEYADEFGCIEINSSFYRIFKKSVFEKWAEITPVNFIFTAKLNRLFTHRGGLKSSDNLVDWFFESVSGLGKKLKAILIQLPPSLKFEQKKTADFLKKIEAASPVPLAIEPRHTTWFTGEFYRILKKLKIALCAADTGGKFPTSLVKTANFSYARLHGPRKLYASFYSRKELEMWKKRIEKIGAEKNFVFFDNTMSGFAVKNARMFRKLVSLSETPRKKSENS